MPSFIQYRLLTLVAEDAAIDDTIYHLSRGLYADKPSIDLDRFLKVREFSSCDRRFWLGWDMLNPVLTFTAC